MKWPRIPRLVIQGPNQSKATNQTKRTLVVFAALAGMLLVGSLAYHPSKAKAAYASPVNVVNTTSNPAGVRDEDSPGRNAFQTQVQLDLNGVSGTGLTIPAGKRLVIDYVTVAGSGPSAGTQPYLEIFTTVNGGPSVGYQLKLTQSPLAGQQFDDSEKVEIPGDTAFVSLAFAGNNPFFLSAGVSISGHLIDIP